MKRYTASSGRSSQFRFRLFVPREPRLRDLSKGLFTSVIKSQCLFKHLLNHALQGRESNIQHQAYTLISESTKFILQTTYLL